MHFFAGRMLLCALSLVLAGSAHAAVEISSRHTKNMTCSNGVCTPTAPKAILNVKDLANMLASADVAVQSGSLAKDIDFHAALSWTSSHRLTLDSFHSIAFNDPIAVTGTGALTITTNDGGSGGDFRFFGKGHIKFWDDQSSLVINGDTYFLVKSMKELRFLAGRRASFLALANSLNLGKHSYHSAPIPNLYGTFEGLGNTISDLIINDPTDKDLVGLFGVANHGSAIRDLAITSINIQASGLEQGIGALAGESKGQLSHLCVIGTIALTGLGHGTVGGLIGANVHGTLSETGSSVAVSALSANVNVGGLVGKMLVNVPMCATGSSIEAFRRARWRVAMIH